MLAIETPFYQSNPPQSVVKDGSEAKLKHHLWLQLKALPSEAFQLAYAPVAVPVGFVWTLGATTVVCLCWGAGGNPQMDGL